MKKLLIACLVMIFLCVFGNVSLAAAGRSVSVDAVLMAGGILDFQYEWSIADSQTAFYVDAWLATSILLKGTMVGFGAKRYFGEAQGSGYLDAALYMYNFENAFLGFDFGGGTSGPAASVGLGYKHAVESGLVFDGGISIVSIFLESETGVGGRIYSKLGYGW